MIKTLSYITKINSILQYSNSLLVTLMKNLDMKFQEKSTKVKYEEYFFNGIQSAKNIGIKNKLYCVKVTLDIDNIKTLNKYK